MLIFLLLVVGPLSVSQPLIIDRQACSANINGYFYDFERISKQIGLNRVKVDENTTLVYQLCEKIPHDKFPATELPLFGTNAYFEYLNGSSIAPLSYFGTTDYEFIDTDDPSLGSAIKNAFIDKNTSIEYRFVNEILCDPNIDQAEQPVFSYFENPNLKAFVLTYKHSSGCPSMRSAPKPRHNLQQSCYFRYEEGSPDTYVELNSRIISTNSTGYVVSRDSYTNYYLDLCGSIDCPMGMTCDVNNATVYVCDETDSTCTMLMRQENRYFKDMYDFVGNDLMVFYNGKDINYVQYQFQCDESLPQHMPVISEIQKSVYEIIFLVRTSGMCLKHGKADIDPYVSMEITGHTFGLNMSYAYSTLTNNYSISEDEYLTYYPGDLIKCPGNICDSTVMSNMWHCKRNELWYCDSYGAKGFPPSLLFDDMPIQENVIILYEGLNGKKAYVHAACDKHLYPDVVNITSATTDEAVNLYVMSGGICNAKWTMPAPQPTTTPKPYDYQSMVLWAGNSTHSSRFDVSVLTILEPNMHLISDLGVPTPFELYLTPFIPLQCPYPGACSSSEMSNSYACSMHNGERRCYSLISDHMSLYPYQLHDTEGAGFYSYGEGDMMVFVDIECDSDEYINTTALYYPNRTIHIHMKSMQTCLQELVQPTIPPTPVPMPAITGKPKPIEIKNNKATVSFKDFKSRMFNTIIRLNTTRQDAFYIVAFDGLAKCPSSADCLGISNSTCWKCWDTMHEGLVCYSLADSRTGIAVNGSTIRIGGGYTGGSVTFEFLCEESVKHDDIRLRLMSYEDNNENTLYFSSSRHCANSDDDSSDKWRYLYVWVVSIVLILLAFAVIGFVIVKLLSRTRHLTFKDSFKVVFCCKTSENTQIDEKLMVLG